MHENERKFDLGMKRFPREMKEKPMKERKRKTAVGGDYKQTSNSPTIKNKRENG